MINLPRLRLRYLTVLGLVGCQIAPTPPLAPRRTALGPGAWSLEYPALAGGHARGPGPSCPSGTFCVTAPAPGGGPAAPAPYGACPATVAYPGDARGEFRRVRFDPNITRSERAGAPQGASACCYQWFVPCPGGRILRDGNHAVLPEGVGLLEAGSLAQAWALEAAYEHASVASFQSAALDWMALGAPWNLLEDAQRAALDEIAHARALYDLASRHAGHAVRPGALPRPREVQAVTVGRVTRETFLDACVNECVAAALAGARASLARDPDVRAALETIARDEEAHADLAWRVLAWLLQSGGDEARSALSAALDALEALPPPEPTLHAPEEGLLGAEAQRAIRDAVLAGVVRPCADALLADGRAPVVCDDVIVTAPVVSPTAAQPLDARARFTALG